MSPSLFRSFITTLPPPQFFLFSSPYAAVCSIRPAALENCGNANSLDPSAHRLPFLVVSLARPAHIRNSGSPHRTRRPSSLFHLFSLFFLFSFSFSSLSFISFFIEDKYQGVVCFGPRDSSL